MMDHVEVAILATSQFEQFEITLKSIEPLLSFEKRLHAPCSVEVKPEMYAQPLSVICTGRVMYGHMSHDPDSGALVATVSSMLEFLNEQGYEILLSPQYEKYLAADNKPLTEAQERDYLAHSAANAGIVY